MFIKYTINFSIAEIGLSIWDYKNNEKATQN
jgi:hypothetical protein